MPEGPDGKTIIIVKKVSGHGGHHGGAWKVAYADFVTAMMALFMVLWLVNTASVATRERVASYFREPGVFEKGSGTPLELGGAGILPDAFAPPSDANSQTLASKKIYNVASVGGSSPDAFDTGQGISSEEAAKAVVVDPKALEIEAEKAKAEALAMEDLAEQIKDEIALAEAAAAAAAGGQSGAGAGAGSGSAGGPGKRGVDGKLLGKVDVKVDQRGLHIEIMDTEKASMFESGSASIKGDAEAELLKIAEILKKVPNPIDIEGHTDATPYSETMRNRYDNWNLASDRAHAARRIFEQSGIQEKQIARVVGYAAQRLKVPDQPNNPTNRRISISMRFTEMAAKALEGTNAKQTEPRKIGAEEEEQKKKEAAAAAAAAVAKAAALAEQQAKAAPTPPPVPAAQLEVGSSTTRRTQGGLAVEVGTHLPEGEIITEEPSTPTRPSKKEGWMEKDKIFGNKNPFLPE